jgi:hypothetical protein
MPSALSTNRARRGSLWVLRYLHTPPVGTHPAHAGEPLTRARAPKKNRDEWGPITLYRNRWRLRYLAPDGKRRSGGTFRTRDEAEVERTRLRVHIEGGGWRAKGRTDSPTVSAFARTWLAGAEARGELAPRTVALYKRQKRTDGNPRAGPWRGRTPLTCSVAEIYLIAASTMAMSCSVVPPLTPTPAMTWPSFMSGTPPPIAEYLPPETARRG